MHIGSVLAKTFILKIKIKTGCACKNQANLNGQHFGFDTAGSFKLIGYANLRAFGVETSRGAVGPSFWRPVLPPGLFPWHFHASEFYYLVVHKFILICGELALSNLVETSKWRIKFDHVKHVILTDLHDGDKMPAAGRGVSSLSFNKTQRQKLNTVAMEDSKKAFGEKDCLGEDIWLAFKACVCGCGWVFERSTHHQITQTKVVLFVSFPTVLISSTRDVSMEISCKCFHINFLNNLMKFVVTCLDSNQVFISPAGKTLYIFFSSNFFEIIFKFQETQWSFYDLDILFLCYACKSLEGQTNILCKLIIYFYSLEYEPLPLPLSPKSFGQTFQGYCGYSSKHCDCIIFKGFFLSCCNQVTKDWYHYTDPKPLPGQRHSLCQGKGIASARAKA
ncbi:hypothetical protein VP01_3982g1 [Puccinia sorghi]|uniref:Uncharacterized protein n=1 Tax=Puccinia sorghi TaxID=27349 RepID=A0A0L6US57_9BASI|nr:hypothetical protein VP01_3982g1 [Puccinia sorghi]